MSSYGNYMSRLSQSEKKKKKEKEKAYAEYMQSFDKSKQAEQETKSYYKSQISSEIAPVKTTTGVTVLEVPKTTVTAPLVAETKKRNWFEAPGYFDDGWDMFDVSKTILSSANDLGDQVQTGIIGMGEKAVDTLAWLGTKAVTGTMGLIKAGQTALNNVTGNEEDNERVKERYESAKNRLEDKTSKFIAKDLYDEEAVAKKLLLSPTDLLKYVPEVDGEEGSVFGDKADSLAQSGGQLVGQVALQSVGVPWFVTSGVTSFGGETEAALNEGATFDQAGGSALISATAEVLTEKLSGGIKFGGKTLDDVLLKPLTENISNKVLQRLVNFGIDALGEGAEEVISGIFSRLGTKLYKEEDLSKILWSEEALDEYLEGFLGGMFLGGASNIVTGGADGNDTDLTDIEQKVVDKVVEDRIAEATEDGKKPTKAEEKKIREEVRRALDRGYIDTDTIESVLGGEEYETYKRLRDARTKYEQSINDEIKALQEEYKKLQGEYEELNELAMTEAKLGDHNRQTEIKARQKEINAKIGEVKAELKELEADTSVSDLKAKFDENFSNVYKGSRLEESYREIDRHKQTFTADINQYESEYAKKTIQNAIDYGMDDTNEAHDFMDLAIKIATDKNVEIVFTTTEGLAKSKENGNPYNIKADVNKINAFISEKHGKMFINMDTKKSLQSLVGHEITHPHENAKTYEGLHEAVKSYLGETEYNKMLESKTKAYEGLNLTEADIEKEIIADFCGERLFTDYDFVQHLSTENRNIFQKIYDEIKYLCKLATAGSKEARQLEKVKHQFEKVWKESAKASAKTEGTKNSLSESKTSLTAEQEEYFKDSKVRDENGNLKVMYHGTSKGGFTSFDTYGSQYGLFGTGSYFTDNKSVAESYTNKGKGNNKQVYETYLNITNPLDMDAQADVDAWSKAFPDADFTNCTTNEDCYRAMEEYFEDEQYSKWEASEIAVDTIRGMGYDGITHIGGGRVNADGERHQVYIAFEPEQIKNIDNIAPTKDADIRYSLTETDNKYLSAVESGDTETAQRMVDKTAKENGYTIHSYHGTRDKTFTEFKKDFIGSRFSFDDKGFFFIDRKSIADDYAHSDFDAKAYGRILDVYLKVKKPLMVDKNFCLKEGLGNPFRDDDAIGVWDAYSEFFKEEAENRKSDGIILDDGMSKMTVVFDPNQIKSAEPITYDDNGNVIPLSERFKAENNDIRYSLSEDIDNIDKILYNNDNPLSIDNRAKTNNNSSINWVYKAEIFSVKENKLFHEKISEINQGSKAFSKNAKDEYMIPIGNKIVFTNGNYDSPYVSEIVEVLTEYQTEFEDVRERIFDVEKGKSSKQDAARYVDLTYGKGRIVTYTSGVSRVYGWENGKPKGTSRSSVIKNYLRKQFRAGNDSKGQEAQINEIAPIKETSSEDGVFFDAENTKYSLSDSDSSFKNVYGFTVKRNAKVNEDLLEELSIWHPDAQVDSDGNVTVYHRTSKENADKIRKTGIMTALEDALFFSSKSEGYASDYGDTVVAFKIPSTVLRVNDIFDGEVHFDVPLKRINNQWSMNVSKYLVVENANNDTRYSLSEDTYSHILDMQSEVVRLRNSIKEIEASEDFKIQTDKLVKAVDSDNVIEGIKAYQQWKEESGYAALVDKRDALQVELENLRKKAENEYLNEELEKEKVAIAKSGLSEADFFRKQAVKEFGYTPFFYDAGYITPNGKMLNFSGEKGKHYGTRGEDHRGIGRIYADTQGTDALNRFMRDGNIRIIAESPGIDISTVAEPTKEQYSTIRRFLYEYMGKDYFNVDFSDESGRVIGSLEYENRINPTRVLNDIKHFYATGEIREQNDIEKYRYSLSEDGETFEEYGNFNTYAKDILVARDIAPTVSKTETVEDIAPISNQYEAIEPRPKVLVGEEAQWAKNKMARADKVNTEQPTANILTEEPNNNKKKSPLWSKFLTNFVDKAHPFETLSLKTGNREVDAKFNSIRYSDTKAQNLIGKGAKGVKALNDIKTEVEKNGLTKSLYEYLYHKHNVDRMTLENRYEDIPNKAVFGDSVTAETSQDIVNQYEIAEPKLKEYAQEIYNYNKHLRKLLVDGGVISQETADLWEEMYPHYVPIRRAGDKGLDINVPLDTGRTGINAPIKQATGGNSDILPLFDTMAQRTLQTYKAIAKNRFGVELKNTLGTTIGSSQTNLDEVIDSIDAHNDLLQKGKNGNNPTFTVFENGEKVTFEITEEMYDAMKPTSEGLAQVIKPFNKMSNYMRGVLTEYNPTFMLTNAIKDAQDVLLNSQHAARTYKNFPKAVTELLKGEKGKWYTEYMENGGADNTYFDKQTNTFSKEKSTFAKVIGFPLEKISEANNFIEKIPRLAEYIASRESGRSIDVSMLDSARVTTNFAAGGDVTKFANRNGFTFLNASVQGAAQQVRNVREAKANGLKGWATLATKVALAGLPSILLNNLLWDDDEEYEELSDYVKQNYYVVAKTQDGKFIRIPKGRAMAVIQSAFEQVQNAFTGDDEADWNSVLELAISNLAPNNPIDNNIVAPIFQAIGNKTWYGEDLVPTRLQDLPAAEQHDESTDALSKWLGEKINVSPYKINYLLNQYSGGIGDVVLPMLTPEAESGDNSLLGNFTAPLKDKFTTDSVLNNKNPSDFFSLSDELKVNANSSKATDEDKLKYKYINAVNTEISDLYKQKREIQNSNLSDDLKFKQVRDIQAQINEMSKNALDTYENVKIDGSYANVGGRHFRLNDEGEWQKITDEQLEKQNDAIGILGITAGQYWSNKEEYDMMAFEPEIYEVLQREGISVEDYKENHEKWLHFRNDDFSWAANNPEKYTISKAITDDVVKYREITSGLYEIRADKDANGKTINGSAKAKKKEYIWGLDIDDGAKYILFKNEYNADDTYNEEIVDYLNSRDDISYDEMNTILEELGFTVDRETGYIYW